MEGREWKNNVAGDKKDEIESKRKETRVFLESL